MDTNKPRTTEVTQAELELLEACRRAPHLAGNLTYLLDRYQAETNTGMDANQAEMRIVDIVRAMGSRLLTQWGEEPHAEIAARHFSNPGLIGDGKKKLRWHSTFGSIAIHQQVFRSKADGKTLRPFLAQAKVTACGCSLPLRRRLVDFSSERSMEGAAQALKEHYGISLSASVINKVTQETGLAAKAFNAEVPAPAKSADLIVVQIDGSMVPIVEYGEAGAEQKAEGMKRKRECFWKEFRLCTASRPGEEKTRYGLTDGSPFEAGCMMYQTAKAEEVIAELGALRQEHPQKEAVEACHRYLGNRTAHLRYAEALAAGLPIGSGEVESGHRSVLQKRLKKPGAWWHKPNAESMGQIKTLQANGHWENLWQKLAA